MTPKAEKQLKFMFSCLFEGTTDPKVIITTAANGCKVASENMDSISPCRFMEQNPKRVYGSISGTTALGVCRHESPALLAGATLGQSTSEQQNAGVKSEPRQCRNGSNTPS